MQTSKSDIKSIIDRLALLSKAERDEVMNVLRKLKDSEKNSRTAKITELAGLGKEMWQGIDVDQYIRELRDEWDDRNVR